MPMPMLVPMPPLRFSQERLTPMRVRIKAAKGMAKRLWYSTSKVLMPAAPRSRWRSINSLSCGTVIVSCCPRT